MLYLYAMPVGELAAVKGSVFDLIGERILGARAGDILGLRRDGQRCGGFERDGHSPARACITRWRATACSSAAAANIHPKFKTPHVSDRRAGRVGELLILTGKRSTHCRTTPGLPSCSSPVLRWPLFRAARVASRTRRDPSRRSAIPIAPAIFVAASFFIVVNAHFQPARSDGLRPARDGCRHPAIHVADTAAKSAGLKPGTTYDVRSAANSPPSTRQTCT